MCAQWDYRDTTTPYDFGTGDYSPAGIPTPSVNSHYARQTIWWSLPLALTGQELDARKGTLSFHVDPYLLAPPAAWPVLLPAGAALMQRSERDERIEASPFCVRVRSPCCMVRVLQTCRGEARRAGCRPGISCGFRR